ncbi:ParB N-terminal domain-containing protein [uncultured Parolsenella sp.]|uniref:ParB/Srx family N-terminal domain-containing protein n=1 Tax=uncultured Parolsenella sp. TaxID=2083008 RepID=UPI0027D953B8|nr:ParB N-terminal domain-containing protein [uncultured Parolsenella sp.]
MEVTSGRYEMVPVAELVPYDGNAKEHTNAQIDAVKASMSQLGFGAPLVCWHNDDGRPEIVAGHARAIAAKQLGIERVPVVFRDDWTDAQRRAYTLADNQTTMMTGWDDDQLAYELDTLADEFDMGDFGFDAEAHGFSAIDSLMRDGLVSNSQTESADGFSVTFVFDNADRERVTAYLKAMGKDAVASRIAEEAREWE